MGYADTMRNAIDGRTYTVSTVKKFETWECAVFEGTNAFLMGLGRGMRYIEYVFPWDGDPAAIHRQIVQMAATDDSNSWQMSKQEIDEARTVATAFVTNEMRKFLSLIEKDGWRVRKGRVRQPRGFSKPLFIPDQVADTTSPRAADVPMRRYAKKLLELAEEGAKSIVPDASGVTFGLVSEFCYFLIQWAQRTAVVRLTDAQMRDVIPRLCFSVFDALVDRAGLDLRKPEDFEARRAEWINDGAYRNDVYRRCRAVAPKEGEGASGTLLWEASRIIAKAAHQDHPATEVTVAMLLPALGSRLDVNDLVAASQATRQIAAHSTPLENNPPALANRTPAQVGTGTSTVKPEASPPPVKGGRPSQPHVGAVAPPAPRRKQPWRSVVIVGSVLAGVVFISIVAMTAIGSKATQRVAPSPTPNPTPSPTPERPYFVVIGAQWDGSCSADGCPASATFRNAGGDGNSIAVFSAKSEDKSVVYGTCTVVIPTAPHNGSSGAACRISGGTLTDFFRQNPSGKVYLFVDVKNP